MKYLATVKMMTTCPDGQGAYWTATDDYSGEDSIERIYAWYRRLPSNLYNVRGDLVIFQADEDI